MQNELFIELGMTIAVFLHKFETFWCNYTVYTKVYFQLHICMCDKCI